MKDKIDWKKPDYKNHYSRVSDKEIERMCKQGSKSTGDILIEKQRDGREIKFIVYRVEKVGILVEGIDTLSRTRAIQELKKVLKPSEVHR